MIIFVSWRENTRGNVPPIIHTQSWLNPIITWYQLWFIVINNLLIKTNFKFDWRTIAAAMLPCNCGKYRSRLLPCRENAGATFVRKAKWVNRTAPDWCHQLGDNNVNHAVCLKAEFLLYIPFQRKWYVLHIYDMQYPCLNRSVRFRTGSPTWRRFV